ncbi:hypothetical protein M8J77_018453 [Diaphorina citri]|nr:hypothetical protein M8J77_018453 [Diaphorina citri]
MELSFSIQTYEWGKIGLDSKVAQLVEAAGGTVDKDKNYAELWLGTHPSGPSSILSQCSRSENLESWIKNNPHCLGTDVISRFGEKLPFLLKVLSVDKALSIQMHPSKEQAVKLHREFPDIYKDENHKPELAIALSKFEALCGFKPLERIKKNIEETKELQAVIGESLFKSMVSCMNNDHSIEVFKEIFHAIMSAPQAQVEKQLCLLNETIHRTDESSRSEEMNLFSRVYSRFPGDCGCFCVFLFNYVCLEEGQSIYIGANEPHAYLKGDCIECMACSDNVIRAGLTPKFKDIATLCSLLNYKFGPPEAKLLIPVIKDESCRFYLPPVADFAVAKIQVKSKYEEYKMESLISVSICLCLCGCGIINGNLVSPGKAYLIPAYSLISIINESDTTLELCLAFANVQNDY